MLLFFRCFSIDFQSFQNTFGSYFRMANFDAGDEKSNRVGTSAGGSGINEYVKSLFDQSITWKDMEWLRR